MSIFYGTIEDAFIDFALDATTTSCEDRGIGPYEYWGAQCYHKEMVEVPDITDGTVTLEWTQEEDPLENTPLTGGLNTEKDFMVSGTMKEVTYTRVVLEEEGKKVVRWKCVAQVDWEVE